MKTEELSREEEIHLYNLSSIPLFIFFIILAIYFVYLMHNGLLKSMWDVIIRIGLPLMAMPPTVIFSSFEVLYRRKVKKPLGFHLKRFAGRMMIIAGGASLFFAILSVFDAILSLLKEELEIFIYSGVVWFVVWFVVVVRFKQVFDKLYEGQW